MKDLKKWTQKAQHSAFYLFLLNLILRQMIPFNKPTGIRIKAISEFGLEASMPYKRSNHNHIKGIHACALATLAEFTTGFCLLSALDSRRYRLIMQSLSMDYHYQARMDVHATFSIDPTWLDREVIEPLTLTPKVTTECEVHIMDNENNHIATGRITWQVKAWDAVKTKI